MRWTAVYTGDDGTVWSFTLQQGRGGERRFGYDYTQRRINSDGLDHEVPNVLAVVNAPITARVGLIVQPESLHLQILDVLADHLSTDEWIDGKVLRHRLRSSGRDVVSSAVNDLIPKYVRRAPSAESSAPVDHFSLTLAGLLRSKRAQEASRVIEQILALLGSKFDANPSFSQFTLEEIRTAIGITNKVDRFLYCVINVAGLSFGCNGSGTEWSFGAPIDSEYISDHRTWASYLAYLRQGTSDRPSPTAPLILDSDAARDAASTAIPNSSASFASVASPDPNWTRLRTVVRALAEVIASEPKRLAALKPQIERVVALLEQPAPDAAASEIGYLLERIDDFVARWRPSDNPEPDAFYIPPAWAGNADREVREARRLLQEISNDSSKSRIADQTEGGMKVFVSHSSVDKPAAEALVQLLRASLMIRSDDIRCTSVDGFKLPAGTNSDDQLRQEIFETQTFVALLSPTSLKSVYVMFELGARWSTKRHLAPIMIGGLMPSELKAPLSAIHSSSGTSEGDIHQLIRDLSNRLGVTPEPPNVYAKDLHTFIDRAR